MAQGNLWNRQGVNLNDPWEAQQPSMKSAPCFSDGKWTAEAQEAIL